MSPTGPQGKTHQHTHRGDDSEDAMKASHRGVAGPQGEAARQQERGNAKEPENDQQGSVRKSLPTNKHCKHE